MHSLRRRSEELSDHGRRVPSRRGRRWDEPSIRAALTEFLRGWEVWPTYDEFVAGGAKGLRDALTRIGGPQRWAAEMGLAGGERRPGGVRRWTDETIRATLGEFFGDRSTWPTQREFDEAGHHGLREALRHHGGPERWAREMGVLAGALRGPMARRPQVARAQPQAATSREWPLWNDRRIAAELAVFLNGRSEWPRYADFVAAGRQGLYHAVLIHGGTHTWARRMRVKWVKRHGGAPPYWTPERVCERLTVLLQGRTAWPTAAAFDAAGEQRLLAAVRRLGGVERWRREFGLQGPRRSAERPRSRHKRH